MGQGSLMLSRKDATKHDIYQKYCLFCYCGSNIVFIICLYHSKLHIRPYKVNYMFFIFVAFSIGFFSLLKNNKWSGAKQIMRELFHFAISCLELEITHNIRVKSQEYKKGEATFSHLFHQKTFMKNKILIQCCLA